MIKQFFSNPAVFERLHAGSLGDYIEAFAQALSDRGYAVWTAKYAMRLLADLNTWLEQNGRTVSALDEQVVDAFLQHLYQSHRQHGEDQGTLVVVLAYLRSHGVLTPVAERQEDYGASSIRGAFHRHLISQHDLALSTVQTYWDTVRRFLDGRFGAHSLQFDTLCAQDVTDFMLEQARRYSAGHTQLIASALLLAVPAPSRGYRHGFGALCAGAGAPVLIGTAQVHAGGGCRALVAVHRPG
jgi:hypothetical protein